MKITAFMLLATATAARAEIPPGLEVGAALGGHAFSSDAELGADDRIDDAGPASGPALGLRVAYPFARRLAAEAEVIAIASEDDVLGDAAMVYGVRAHARFDVANLIGGKLRPFVVAGIGMHVLRSDSPQMSNDSDGSYHWGAGVRYAIAPSIDLRLDARHLIVPSRTIDGATSDIEITAGATYRFGVKKPPPARIATTPPPAPRVDPAVEDRDRDGIPDVADSCPDHAETDNHWQDLDGCPDEVIRELAGIGFENDSARIDAASTPILDRAYEILRDNPGLTIEIAGHTSAEGGDAYNLDLSQRRAETVKTYLVRRGIAEGRIRAIGHGADVPLAHNDTEEGRRRNRRIEFRVLD